MTPARLSLATGGMGEVVEGPLSRLSSLLQFEHFADGAVVLREGDQGDWLGVVLQGEGVVEKQIDGDPNTVEVLATVSRGDVIGEMAFVDNKPRSATVRARGPMQLARLAKSEFRSIMASDPESAEVLVGTLLSTLASRLRDANDALVALYQAGRLIGAARDVEDVSAAVLQQVAAAVPGASIGVVALFDGPRTCRPVVSFGLPATLATPFHLDPAGPLLRQLLATPTGLVIAADDPRAAEVAFVGAAWCLVTELVHDDRTLGLVALGSNEEQNPFRASHEVLMAVLADHVAAAVGRYSAAPILRLE